MPPLEIDRSLKERLRIMEDYKNRPEAVKKYCTDCGMILEYQTWGWHEGRHFDGCYNDNE